jgi:hypothetical protein
MLADLQLMDSIIIRNTVQMALWRSVHSDDFKKTWTASGSATVVVISAFNLKLWQTTTPSLLPLLWKKHCTLEVYSSPSYCDIMLNGIQVGTVLTFC